jgi:hypothetical protein
MDLIWTLMTLAWILVPLGWLSLAGPVSAMPFEAHGFPDLSFIDFSNFITANFTPSISLQAVLVILFSILENPEVLALHARQQVKLTPLEQGGKMTSWITMFSQLLVARLGQDCDELLSPITASDRACNTAAECLSLQIEGLAKLLGAFPQITRTRHTFPPSYSSQSIEPIHLICSPSFECENAGCLPWSLLLTTRFRDVTSVHLIKGSQTYSYAYPLSGSCSECGTTYTADSEHSQANNFECYINTARYLKLGTQTWADRTFCTGVVNGMYSFHALSSAYMEYWNHSYASQPSFNISRRHVWQAFVQESVRTLASGTGQSLVVSHNLPIEDVPKEAFHILGSNGVIQPAHHHACTECTHPYKEHPDTVPVGEVAGEENQQRGVENRGNNGPMVNMVVVDGIVMGTTVSYPFLYNFMGLNKIYSTVLIQTAQVSLITTVAMLSIQHILNSGKTDVTLLTVKMIVFLTPRLAKNTSGIMKSIAVHIAGKTWLECAEFFNSLMSAIPGNKEFELLTSHMTILWWLQIFARTTLVLPATTVLRLLWRLVVLC